MKDRWTYLIIFIFIAAVGYIYSNKFINDNNPKENNISVNLKVYTSIYPLYFFAQEISGGKVEVKNITPAGAEPHDYDPSARDFAAIESGNMLILNGGVETWANKIKNNLKESKVKIVIAAEGLELNNSAGTTKQIQDPHVWLSPVLSKKLVEKITRGFEEIDPSSSSLYKTNGEKLKDKLNSLDAEFKSELSNCRTREFITSHNAFTYLAKEYGLTQIAISGISPDEEPSSKKIVEISKLAKKNNIKYIFFETLVSPKLAETIANEIGAKTLVLDPIEGMSDDDIKQGNNYFTVMQKNLNNLKIALSCTK